MSLCSLNQDAYISFVNMCKSNYTCVFCCSRVTHHIHAPQGKAHSKSLSWDPHKTGSDFSKGLGCRTLYVYVCLLSQYCILFRLPLGGTVSKKTRKEMGWKQRKRKGNQCDGACPSLILVQPESCGQWRHRCNLWLWSLTEDLLFLFLKWKHKQPHKVMNGRRIDGAGFSLLSQLKISQWYSMRSSTQQEDLRFAV